MILNYIKNNKIINNMINIAEILKDCPKGTKLYSPIFGDVYFYQVTDFSHYIQVTLNENGKHLESFFLDGRYKPNGECMLFPSKDNRNWATFQRPFKDGDIVFYNNTIAIFKEWSDDTLFRTYCVYYINVSNIFSFELDRPLFGKGVRKEIRLATEDEKQMLFDAIKDYSYKWNAETKTLEELIEPKFKVGDIITNGKITFKIGYIDNEYYYNITRNIANRLFIKEQDNWELVPNKFDITNLKPFDKVLVRTSNSDIWECEIFSSYDPNCSNPFHCTARWTKQCVPFEGNEHLLGTNNDCDEYYKTW